MGRWGRHRDWGPRPSRPKAEKLSKAEQEKKAARFAELIGASPVLAGLGVQVSAARGRFYLERPTEFGSAPWGRITPLEGVLLLEREHRAGQWYEVARGQPKKVIDAVAGDEQGTFHGLGSINARLLKVGASRPDVVVQDGVFLFPASGERCTAQEALYFYFGIPLNVLIQPRGWYARHRRPAIVEWHADRSRVRVTFTSYTLDGAIVGTCLYVRHSQRDGDSAAVGSAMGPGWAAYAIRPNASQNIDTAEAWLVKRKWKSW